MNVRLLFISALLSTLSFGQTFSEIIKATAGDRAIQDRFGYSVAIDGNYAVVGAYADDFGETNPNMGSAYIYEKSGVGDWTFVQKIFNSDQDDYDRFGWSVAIDGNYIVVGAYAEDHDTNDENSLTSAGSAYIFERNEEGEWIEIQKIIASDRTSGDEFGWDVAISGNTIVVGAHFDNENEIDEEFIHHAGSAYIFDQDDEGIWIETQKIVGSGRAADITFPDGGGGEDLSDQFGGSVAITGDFLIVGSHHHDYDESGGDPIQEAGAAYIFERTGLVWTEVAKLQNDDREAQDRFGFDVGITENFAVVSAYSEDDDELGGSSLNNAGSVYVFERAMDGVWSQSQKIVASDRSIGDRFGWSVDIDETTLLVGAIESSTDAIGEVPLTDAGAAYTYVFDEDLGDWIELNKIDASDRQEDDLLGCAVGLSGNGIILGAYQQNFDFIGEAEMNDAGAVYFYTREICTPSESSQTITLCAGQTLMVGPYSHDTSGIFVDVLLSESGCDSTVTSNLTVIPAPFSTQTAEICFGYTYDVAGSSYTESGEYVDTLTAVDGCDSLIFTTLFVSPENAVTQEITICWGESFEIGASTYDEPGTYTDVLTSSELCDSTITTILSVQLPVDKSISQDLNLLTAGSETGTFQWIKCDPFEVIEGATDQSYWAPLFGKYAVIVTEGVCSDTSSCVYVDQLGIADYKGSPQLRIYPNPSTGIFYLDSETTELIGTEWTITNLLGATIVKFSIQHLPQTVNLNNLSKGIYVLNGTDSAGYPQSYQLVLE